MKGIQESPCDDEGNSEESVSREREFRKVRVTMKGIKESPCHDKGNSEESVSR